MILGVDPSLTGCGWCLMDKENGNWRVVDGGIIKTSNETKKRRIYKADDDSRRIREIFKVLSRVVIENDIEVLVSEQPSGGGKSASAVKGMAFATAIVACLAEAHKLAMVTVTARSSKKATTGKANASKTEMQKAVAERFPEFAEDYKSTRSANGFKGDFEDIADSICAIITAEDEPAVVMGCK